MGGSTSVPEVGMSSAPKPGISPRLDALGCGLQAAGLPRTAPNKERCCRLVDRELSPGEQAGCPLSDHSAPWKLGS